MQTREALLNFVSYDIANLITQFTGEEISKSNWKKFCEKFEKEIIDPIIEGFVKCITSCLIWNRNDVYPFFYLK